MADPLTPEQIQALTEATNNNTQAVVANNDAVGASSNSLFGLSSQVGTSNTTLSNFNGTIAKQAGLFNLLQTSILGSQNAFAGLNNIDPRSITTFSGHFNDLQLALKESGPVAKMAENAIKGMGLQLERSGFKDFIGAGKMAASTILGLIQNITKNADAAIEFEGAMLQTAAATGEFGKMMSQAGPDMEKLNVLLDNQVYALDMASKATNSTREQIKGYYDTLRMVPGAMSQMVNANAAGTEKMSMLTATIKLAHGTGRSYNEVVKDLHKSFTDYGVSGEAALKFTARFSEISNKYGIELADVRAGLLGATDAFKDMTNAGEGAAKMQESVSKFMNDYVQRLKDSGMTGKHAIDTVHGVTNAMAGLNIAQKAFISAQSGGPGGLVGGFQIEKMIQQGDIEGLQKKMMQTMQRQFGKIVTLDEATKSPAAAAQLEKQTMMLRQGPMGSLVKTDQDAYKFLDAMKAQQEGRPLKGGAAVTGLDPNAVQNAIKTGSTWEQKTHTVVSDISNDLRAIRNRLLTTGLNEIQGAFTSAVTPEQGVLTENQLANQKNLKDSFAEAQLAGTREARTAAQEMKEAGPLRANRTEDRTKENYADLAKSLSNIPSAVKSGLDTIWRPTETPAPTPPLNAMIDQKRQAQGGTPPTTPGRQVRDATGKVLPSFLQNMGPAPSPGARVGAATRAPAPPREAAGAAAQNTGAPRALQPNVTVQQQGDSGRINVKVIVTEEPSPTNADAISKAGSISP